MIERLIRAALEQRLLVLLAVLGLDGERRGGIPPSADRRLPRRDSRPSSSHHPGARLWLLRKSNAS